MDDNGWVSAHIFYHGDLDTIVLDLVRPLVRELVAADIASGFFFLRYWDGGPHVRLRLAVAPGSRSAARRRIEARCAEFLRSRPAPERETPEEYASRASRLAAWEGVTEYARKPFSNNTVRFIPYQPEYHRYGHGGAMSAVERHFGESSRIALRLLASRPTVALRDTVAVSLIMLSWLCIAAGPGSLAHTVHSPPVRTPFIHMPDVAGRFKRQERELRVIGARMRMLAARGTQVPRNGVLAAWSGSVHRLQECLEPATAGRVIDTCAHLVCNRLGVGLTSEGHLRYLAARTLHTSVAVGGPGGGLA